MSLLDRIQLLDRLDVSSRRVFVRADFDVQLDARGEIVDDLPIRDAIPTLRRLLSRGGRVIVGSHLGVRGEDNRKPPSLEPVGRRLAELLGIDVVLSDEPVGDGARKVVQELRDGRLLLLENLLHFRDGESVQGGLAKELRKYADFYVNEAFSASQQTWSTISGVDTVFEQRFAGLALQTELEALSRFTELTRKPFVVILGGSIVSEALLALEYLSSLADVVLFAGLPALALLSAQGRLARVEGLEPADIQSMGVLLERFGNTPGTRWLTPEDLVVSSEATGGSHARSAKLADAPEGSFVFDLGPRTIERYGQELLNAQRVFWIGSTDTELLPQSDSGLSLGKSITDSAALSLIADKRLRARFLEKGQSPRMSHLSSARWPCIQLLVGRKLPGLEALRT